MHGSLRKNSALVYEAKKEKWLFFREPCKIYTSYEIQEIPAILLEIEKQSAAERLYAVGFLAYEAGPAFDKAYPSRENSPSSFPLLYFAMYPEKNLREYDESIFENKKGQSVRVSPLAWKSSISQAEYNTAFQRIKNYISLGESYQVNYSFRLKSFLEENSSLRVRAWSLFQQMLFAQSGPSYRGVYGAYIESEDWILCSASPELFFRLEGNELSSRPMKGTRKRGLYAAEDRLQAELLEHSSKDRAENSMIVDMLRNDMGRIASLSQVRVEKLFQLERYPSLWQMTSDVRARTEAGLFEIFSALFPAASVTGAPKKRTIEIINELEKESRDIYTGSIGFWGPEGQAQFNVAIRTAWIHTESREARYGIGSGIVWDSKEDLEWKECQSKAAILESCLMQEEFSLLETLLWEPRCKKGKQGGYFLLEAHLKRLAESAAYFNFSLDLKKIKKELEKAEKKMQDAPYKLRLLVSHRGELNLESIPFSFSGNLGEENERLGQKYSVSLAKKPLDSKNPFLYHKTSQREVYTQAKKNCPAHCQDVLLWNERGELTESTIANVLVQIQGKLFTPPLHCGLLGGLYRAELLEQNKIQERVILIKELEDCEKIYLLNSVRRQWEVHYAREE